MQWNLRKRPERGDGPVRRRGKRGGQFMGDCVESLQPRRLLAATATFLPGFGLLSVLGDVQDNVIVVSRNGAGAIQVNGGAVPIAGGTPTVANTTLIAVFGLGGNDTISLNEANGPLPAAQLFGGAGNDSLTGGSGNDMLFGQAGNDSLQGKGGDDLLFGGNDDDVLQGGVGNDSVFGEAGNDRMIWNPGEGSDLNEGGAGVDTVQVNGGNGAETFTAVANGSRVRFDRVTPAPFFLDIGTSENLVVNANGGDDTFTGGNGLGALISLTVDGGDGNDTITGGDGNDTLIGGGGNDVIIGGRGSDVVLMGAGDDTAVWNPGDGSDVIEGQDGTDRLLFNGSNAAENIDLSANGSRLRLVRDVGGVTMDVDGTELIDVNALGSADTVTVNDLTGTAVTHVGIDLSSPPGSGVGDGQIDNVIVRGTSGDDVITLAGSAADAQVLGLAAQVEVKGLETTDNLTIDAGAGDDVIDGTLLSFGHTQIGGDGDDVLIGGSGNDTLIGNAGNDLLLGGPGQDVLDGAPGLDTLIQD
jgi:Ca2+-binding RTX toxin-like protein